MGMTAPGMGFVLFDRESSCCPRGEPHVGGPAGLDPGLDVVAVQVQCDRPIAGPAQRDDVALFDADLSHIGRDAAFLDLEIEHDVLRLRGGDGRLPDERAEEQAGQYVSAAFHLRGQASTSVTRLSVQPAS